MVESTTSKPDAHHEVVPPPFFSREDLEGYPPVLGAYPDPLIPGEVHVVVEVCAPMT